MYILNYLCDYVASYIVASICMLYGSSPSEMYKNNKLIRWYNDDVILMCYSYMESHHMHRDIIKSAKYQTKPPI